MSARDWPDRLEIAGELPRNAQGKVLRTVLRQANERREPGVNRAALTALYLDQVRRSGAGPDELAGDVARSDDVLLNLFYPGDAVPVPAGVRRRRRAGPLYADVETVRGLLVSLPDRLYEGDFAAFARDAGATDYQVEAMSASRSDPVSPQARADLYEDASGFRLMEFNMGSALAAWRSPTCAGPCCGTRCWPVSPRSTGSATTTPSATRWRTCWPGPGSRPVPARSWRWRTGPPATTAGSGPTCTGSPCAGASTAWTRTPATWAS